MVMRAEVLNVHLYWFISLACRNSKDYVHLNSGVNPNFPASLNLFEFSLKMTST